MRTVLYSHCVSSATGAAAMRSSDALTKRKAPAMTHGAKYVERPVRQWVAPFQWVNRAEGADRWQRRSTGPSLDNEDGISTTPG